MAGRPNKLTCHQWADRIVGRGGLKAHSKRLADKHGSEYLDDWIAVHMGETKWAKKLLKHRKFTCMDTETTSIDVTAEMVEIGIVDGRGDRAIDCLIRPISKMSTSASNSTGITDEKLIEAPGLKEVYDEIQAALLTWPIMLIYNAEFDLRILNQSTFQVGLPEFEMPQVEDLMLRFSRWVGEWNPRQDDYAWHRLEGGHRALGDCRAMISLLEKMARVPQTNSEWSPDG